MSGTPITTTVDLIRHGEPAGGVRFRGHTDDPLSELGWAQMRAAIQKGRQWDAVISSPLLRCAEFAAELAVGAGIPLETEARFEEIGFGDWEGRAPEELMQTDAGCLDRLWRDPAGYTPPGGEGLAAFAARVTAGWNELLCRHAGESILVVAHGGVNRVILCHALQIPIQNMFRLDVPFAALSRVRVLGNGAEALPQLLFHSGPPP